MRTILAMLAINLWMIGHAQCLTDAEVESILFMKQEEKLAHDVYTALYVQWGQPIFSNIAQSEAQHIAAVDSLIETFSLADETPVEPGKFSISVLQTLYDDLVARGESSLIDALLVGEFIEITDINDLTKAIEASSDPLVINVFSNLRRGSENHLGAFSSKLSPLYTHLAAPELNVQFDSGNDPILSWEDDWENETSLRVERRIGQLPWQELAALDAGATSFVDLTAGVAVVEYRVIVVSGH